MVKILGVGGGSGGHVTPVVAVFDELRKLDSTCELRFWCDKHFIKTARDIFAKFDDKIVVEKISAGKFRRYHGFSKWHYLQPSIFWPNFFDVFRILAGFWQSFWRLLWFRPDVIFLKGGYVCLPVGYVAKVLRIPFVIHDSDAHPGLTNRLLAPFASKIGTGLPLEYYNYPADKAKYVGIPVAKEFKVYSTKEQKDFKRQLGFDEDRPLIVVTGGGLGAVKINNAIADSLDKLLAEASVTLISGNAQYDELQKRLGKRQNWRLEAFIYKDMFKVLAAADLVVARAGATTLLELAALGKPTIIVPNSMLTAGHQLKNAKVYQDNLAAVVVTEEEMESEPNALAEKALQILRAPNILRELGQNFAKFAKPNAAQDVAKIILSVIKQRGDK